MVWPTPTPRTFDQLVQGLNANKLKVRKTEEVALGRGGYAEVFRGKIVSKWSFGFGRSSPVALKCLLKTAGKEEQLYRRIYREVKMWQAARAQDNPHILPFIGVSLRKDLQTIWLVMPYMPRGNLANYAKDPVHTPASRYALIRDVALGLQHLHAHGITHADLKADNCLINSENRVMLTDFGISSILEEGLPPDLTTSLKMGSARWMSPERHHPEWFGMTPAEARTFPCDIFGLAMTMYEVFALRIPFHYTSDESRIVGLITGGMRPEYPRPEVSQERGLTTVLWSYMGAAWSEVPSERLRVPILLRILDGEDPIIPRSGWISSDQHNDGRDRASVPFRRLIQEYGNIEHYSVQWAEGLPMLPMAERTGDYSLVKIGSLETNKMVWAKRLNVTVETHDTCRMVLDAIANRCDLNNRFLLQEIGIFPEWSEDIFWVVSDYLPHRDLERYWKNHPDLPIISPMKFLCGLTGALRFLHSQNIVHARLMPRNILVSSDGMPMLRATSFEACVNPRKDGPRSSAYLFENSRWTAPECLYDGTEIIASHPASNVYSLSMIIYQLLYRHVPFHTRGGDFALPTDIRRGFRPPLPMFQDVIDRGMTERIRELISKSWHAEMDTRPSVDLWHAELKAAAERRGFVIDW